MLGRVLLISALAALSSANNLVAKLDYGTFQGAYSSAYSISYWQKIPYAAPPVGQNRFRAPQPPSAIEGIYDSSQSFDMCPQRTVNGSEDCLYLGLYARPWSKPSPLRPVVVTFHGGGFIQGAASFSLPPSAYPILNVSDTDIMFVYPNYRLNAFGFLPGKEIANDPYSDLNVGLLDQQAVLKWVQKNIREFGGDPDNVSIWGQSAGGGSVIAQVIAKEQDPPLFQKAWASSPFWAKTYRYDSEEAQWIYDELARLTGCAGSDSLNCLKSVDVQTIRDANLIIASSHQYNTSSFTWAPVIDGDFIPYTLTEAAAKKGINTEKVFGMYNTHEGENFIPPGINSATNQGTPAFNSSEASFDVWLKGYLPDFSSRDLKTVKKLYPSQGLTETETWNTTYERAGMIFRDTVLACPAYWLADGAPQGWLGEYTILPAKHASDTYWWNQVNSAQKTDPLHYQGYSGAFASFFATGDPNKLKLTAPDVSGVPSLRQKKEWVINEEGFDNAKLRELRQRCDYWKRMASKIPV